MIILTILKDIKELLDFYLENGVFSEEYVKGEKETFSVLRKRIKDKYTY